MIRIIWPKGQLGKDLQKITVHSAAIISISHLIMRIIQFN